MADVIHFAEFGCNSEVASKVKFTLKPYSNELQLGHSEK